MKRDTAPHALAAGFNEPIHDAQRVFRSLLSAMAHPAQWFDVADGLADAGAWHEPTPRSLVAALLAMCDHDTPVWLSPPHALLAPWLRFHTGAPTTDNPALASFAVCDAGDLSTLLPTLARGTAEYPDRSTTAWVVTAADAVGDTVSVHGPGIADTRTITIPGLPPPLWSQRDLVNGDFPLGVDLMVFNDRRVLGLPRTTRRVTQSR